MYVLAISRKPTPSILGFTCQGIYLSGTAQNLHFTTGYRQLILGAAQMVDLFNSVKAKVFVAALSLFG
jgi:Iap family predicted aminopeptidase